MHAIRQEITVPATPGDVFAALTRSDRFSEMTGQPADIDARPGGAFSLFANQVEGRIVDMERDRRLVEAWRVAPWDEGRYSIVTFEIEAKDGGTRLIILQGGYPEENREHLEAGWKKMYLDPLAAYLA